MLEAVYNLGVLKHFVHWDILWFGVAETFLAQNVRQEKLLKFIKILNYNKSSCIILCLKCPKTPNIYIIHNSNWKVCFRDVSDILLLAHFMFKSHKGF